LLVHDLSRKGKCPILRSYFGRLQSKKNIELIHMFKKVLQRKYVIAAKKSQIQYTLPLNTNIAREDDASAQ